MALDVPAVDVLLWLVCVCARRLPIFFSYLVSTGVKRVDKLFLPQQRKLDDLIAEKKKEVLAIKATSLSRREKWYECGLVMVWGVHPNPLAWAHLARRRYR